MCVCEAVLWWLEVMKLWKQERKTRRLTARIAVEPDPGLNECTFVPNKDAFSWQCVVCIAVCPNPIWPRRGVHTWWLFLSGLQCQPCSSGPDFELLLLFQRQPGHDGRSVSLEPVQTKETIWLNWSILCYTLLLLFLRMLMESKMQMVCIIIFLSLGEKTTSVGQTTMCFAERDFNATFT